MFNPSGLWVYLLELDVVRGHGLRCEKQAQSGHGVKLYCCNTGSLSKRMLSYEAS